MGKSRRSLQVKQLLASLVIGAAVVVPAAIATAEPAHHVKDAPAVHHEHGRTDAAPRSEDRAGADRTDETTKENPVDSSSTWTDASLIGNGGLKYG